MADLRRFVQHRTICMAKPILWRLVAACFLALALCPGSLRAQDSTPPFVDVANLTLVPLSNQSIATVKGGSLQEPVFGNSASSSGTITLWDELKPHAAEQSNVNGASVITINGVTK
ncbi:MULTISPECIES: hypothetical protein [unclassified Acidocella]|uniref:hypothetical protein n=1 Tax=unclassified Acidocella TaxID=2648610 RepID=UPI001181B8B9|nr:MULTISPECIES: hypothetical protein [unclassified Acidocella]WBO59438.1 hypothetical protein GT370_00335 [Acidocella sp. MX-AZ03]